MVTWKYDMEWLVITRDVMDILCYCSVFGNILGYSAECWIPNHNKQSHIWTKIIKIKFTDSVLINSSSRQIIFISKIKNKCLMVTNKVLYFYHRVP